MKQACSRYIIISDNYLSSRKYLVSRLHRYLWYPCRRFNGNLEIKEAETRAHYALLIFCARHHDV